MNEQITRILIEEYGFNTGMRIAGVVMPNIAADFKKKLINSLMGSNVSEEYRFEDLRGSITLYGIRLKSGKCNITAVEVNGKKIEIQNLD